MIYVCLHHLKAAQKLIKVIQIHYCFGLGNDELQTIVCSVVKTPHFKNNTTLFLGTTRPPPTPFGSFPPTIDSKIVSELKFYS